MGIYGYPVCNALSMRLFKEMIRLALNRLGGVGLYRPIEMTLSYPELSCTQKMSLLEAHN